LQRVRREHPATLEAVHRYAHQHRGHRDRADQERDEAGALDDASVDVAGGNGSERRVTEMRQVRGEMLCETAQQPASQLRERHCGRD